MIASAGKSIVTDWKKSSEEVSRHIKPGEGRGVKLLIETSINKDIGYI